MNKCKERELKHELSYFGEIINYEKVKGYAKTRKELNSLIEQNENLVFCSEFGICQIQDDIIVDEDEKRINLSSLEVFQLQELINDIHMQLNNNDIQYLCDYADGF